MKHGLLVSLSLIALGLTLSAKPEPSFRIGVLYWSMNSPSQVVLRQGLEAEAARHPNLSLLVRVAGEGEAGIEKQIHQMQELIQLRPDLIIIQPTDNAALAQPLKQANEYGIPVVAYDQYISEGVLAAYRTSDNEQAGYLDGEYLMAQFPRTAEVRLVLVEYPNVSSTVERVNGFLDALSHSGRAYRILKSYQAVEPISGKRAAQQFIQDFPKGTVDAVFCVNDGGGLSFARELLLAGRQDVRIATVDGDPEALDLLRQNKLVVIDSAQFWGPLGAETLTTAWEILNHHKVPFQAVLPVFPVCSDTWTRYPGWQGPIPTDFTKPWKSDQPQWHGALRVIRP